MTERWMRCAAREILIRMREVPTRQAVKEVAEAIEFHFERWIDQQPECEMPNLQAHLEN